MTICIKERIRLIIKMTYGHILKNLFLKGFKDLVKKIYNNCKNSKDEVILRKKDIKIF